MPGPAILMGPGAVAAAKHLAWQAATSVDVTTFTSATLTAIFFLWIFRNLPDWVKEDISFQNLLKNSNSRKDAELTGLFSVIDKIQHWTRSIQELDHADVNVPQQLHASLLAFIQLSGQLKLEQVAMKKKNESDDDNPPPPSSSQHCTEAATTETTNRDDVFENSGISFPLSSLRSEELQTALILSTWAYYEDSMILTKKLLEHDYTLLRHHLDVRPGNVAHYIAVSPTKRQVVVGLRGTSSLEDIMTDCCGRAVPFVEDDSVGDKVRVEVQAAVPNNVLADLQDEIVEVVSGHERILLEDDDDDGDNFVRCHEGILVSARNVMDEIGSFLRVYLIEYRYRIVFCGHSLGAGTAVVAAVLLRSRYQDLFLNDDDHYRRIHVYAFGPPPVLDHDSAIAASSYCTTIVNNSDFIARLSISNLIVSLACLRKVQGKLAEHDMNPTGPASTMAFLNKLAEGTSGEPILTLSEFHETINETHKDLALRRPEHLFLPGRVLLVYSPWSDEPSGGGDNDSKESKVKSWKCVETTGTSAVFQYLEIDGLRCFTDHLTLSYFEALGIEYEF